MADILFSQRLGAILPCYWTPGRSKRVIQRRFRGLWQPALTLATCQNGDMFPSAGDARARGRSPMGGNLRKSAQTVRSRRSDDACILGAWIYTEAERHHQNRERQRMTLIREEKRDSAY